MQIALYAIIEGDIMTKSKILDTLKGMKKSERTGNVDKDRYSTVEPKPKKDLYDLYIDAGYDCDFPKGNEPNGVYKITDKDHYTEIFHSLEESDQSELEQCLKKYINMVKIIKPLTDSDSLEFNVIDVVPRDGENSTYYYIYFKDEVNGETLDLFVRDQNYDPVNGCYFCPREDHFESQVKEKEQFLKLVDYIKDKAKTNLISTRNPVKGRIHTLFHRAIYTYKENEKEKKRKKALIDLKGKKV